MYCYKCGIQNNSAAKFCKSCGSVLNEEKNIENRENVYDTKRKSKKGIIGVVVIVAVALVLFGVFVSKLGVKSYTCGYCMRTVEQKPHSAQILGQEVELCDDCYDMLKEYQMELN